MNRGARRQRGSSYGHSAALAFSLRVRLTPFAAVQWLSSLRGASAAGSICVGLVRFCLLSIFETSGCTREEDDWDDVTKRWLATGDRRRDERVFYWGADMREISRPGLQGQQYNCTMFRPMKKKGILTVQEKWSRQRNRSWPGCGMQPTIARSL